MTPQSNPSWRKPAGIFLILGWITLWVWIVTTAMEMIGNIATPLQILIYGVAGIIWIAPLRPVLMWMETGKWRARKDKVRTTKN